MLIMPTVALLTRDLRSKVGSLVRLIFFGHAKLRKEFGQSLRMIGDEIFLESMASANHGDCKCQ